MTIETTTALIHEHMYDRLNDSNNSNDGKEIKHVQERPYKRKWTEKTDADKMKKRPEYQKQKSKDNRCGQCGAPNWSRQHLCPTKSAEYRKCKRRGHYEKMCRSMRRVQYVEKTTSSAEEDNWDYEKIQRIENTKQKKGFYNATLLVNNVPIKFIIDSGSPVTLIPECLFSKITPIEPLKTTYKVVNNQKISFTGQTKAMVKTNKETMELPLIVTKAQTAPLMGLDWMQRLKINLNSNNGAIQIHNIILDNTERKIIKLQNDFKDSFYNNKEIKNLSVKINLKTGAQIKQQKGRPIPIHLQNQVAQELKRLIKHGYVEKATEITKDCFVSPSVITVKKQIDKNRT